jgi:predicted ABC-type ATPase
MTEETLKAYIEKKKLKIDERKHPKLDREFTDEADYYAAVVARLKYFQGPKELVWLQPFEVRPAEELRSFRWEPGKQATIIQDAFRLLRDRHLDLERLTYLRLESEFDFVPSSLTPGEKEKLVGNLPEAEKRKVALGLIPCPQCAGLGEVHRPVVGTRTGMRAEYKRTCKCNLQKLFYRQWLDVDSVPEGYRDISMEWLIEHEAKCRTKDGRATSESRFTRMSAAFIDTVLAVVTHPDYGRYNMLLAGPAGAGKSTLMMALYHRALRKWAVRSWINNDPTAAVWHLSARRIAAEAHAWATRNSNLDESGEVPSAPSITTGKITTAMARGHQVCLYLEELDKYNVTDFKNGEIHAVVDAVVSNGGQAVATTNINRERLLMRIGDKDAPAIARRLILRPRGILIDFERGQVILNGRRALLSKDGVIEFWNKMPWADDRPDGDEDKPLNIDPGNEMGPEDKAKAEDKAKVEDTPAELAPQAAPRHQSQGKPKSHQGLFRPGFKKSAPIGK